jgi:hypothetical protein
MRIMTGGTRRVDWLIEDVLFVLVIIHFDLDSEYVYVLSFPAFRLLLLVLVPLRFYRGIP